MTDLHLFEPKPLPTRGGGAQRVPLGRILFQNEDVSATGLMGALTRQRGLNARLGEVLIEDGASTETAVLDALARQFSAQRVDLARDPPQPRAVERIDPMLAVRHGVMPWTDIAGMTLVAANSAEDFDAFRADLPDDHAPVLMAIASRRDIMDAQTRFFGDLLAERAEARVPLHLSCRTWARTRARRAVLGVVLIAAFLVLAAWAPLTVFAVLAGWASLTLVLAALQKAAAFIARITESSADPPALPDAKLPRISLIVPLYQENTIASSLIARLRALSYPKCLLDVILVLEEHDAKTRAVLQRTLLPRWIDVLEVPRGALTTKPRALNYALDFCRGDIVGVYDAEDAPAADQLECVARHFAAAPPEVACLQGVLDYYNPRANWLSRCFAIEYATWFRVMLPGLARLGLAIPLGGTTVFFRRDALLELGGWDAHNVTEDADLGFRLARKGYRTELVRTVTSEEAANRFLPWIRQRSRWLKGYMVTYLVHMRRPMALLRDLGVWRFLGFQVFFLTALTQFLLAPVLLTFWAFLVELPHPLQGMMPHNALISLLAVFFATEILNITVSAFAVSGAKHRHLMLWVPTQIAYFPMGAVAAYKALIELVFFPFYWDKTEHGHSLARRSDALFRSRRVELQPGDKGD